MLDPREAFSRNIDGNHLRLLGEVCEEVAEFPVSDVTGALRCLLKGLCEIFDAHDATWLVMRKQSKLPREISAAQFQSVLESMDGWSPVAAEYLNPEKTLKRVAERWLMHARREGVDPVSKHILQGAGKYPRACIRHDATTDKEWKEHWMSNKYLEFYGVGERLIGNYPMNADCESVMIIDRPMGALPYTEEEREFMLHVISSVPKMHTHLCLERGLLRSSSVLSKREVETYRLLLTDLSEGEIADHMKLSTHTIHDYARHLYRKFGVKGRVGLMAMVLG